MFYTLLIIAAGLLALAGAAKCAVDIMSHQPDNNIFMNWGLWWDNRNSWKRKYKNYDAGDLRPWFPGAKTWAVAITDFWHTCDLIYLKTYWVAGMLAGAALAQREAGFWAYAAVTLAAGFELTGVFELLYKRAFRIRPVAK